MGYITRFNLRIEKYSTETQTFEQVPTKGFLAMLNNAVFVASDSQAAVKYRPEYLAENKALAKGYETLRAKVGPDGMEYFECVFQGETSDTKWYEHETHMQILADLFPEYLFVLTGEGEEQFDVWLKVFQKNTPVEKNYAKVSIPKWVNGAVTWERVDPRS